MDVYRVIVMTVFRSVGWVLTSTRAFRPRDIDLLNAARALPAGTRCGRGQSVKRSAFGTVSRIVRVPKDADVCTLLDLIASSTCRFGLSPLPVCSATTLSAAASNQSSLTIPYHHRDQLSRRSLHTSLNCRRHVHCSCLHVRGLHVAALHLGTEFCVARDDAFGFGVFPNGVHY